MTTVLECVFKTEGPTTITNADVKVQNKSNKGGNHVTTEYKISPRTLPTSLREIRSQGWLVSLSELKTGKQTQLLFVVVTQTESFDQYLI